MKFYSRLNEYKNSTGTNIFNPSTMVATSYNWWSYFKVINGINVFNNFYYSPATSKHQSAFRKLLDNLNINIDLIIESPKGLNNLESARTYYISKINDNTKYCKKKGIRTTTKIKLAEINTELHKKLGEIKELQRNAE